MSFQVRILLVLTAALLPGSLALRGAEPGEREKAARARTDCYGDPLPAGAVARIGTVRFRMGHFPQSLAVSADGKVLAAIDQERTFFVWDSATGRQLGIWNNPERRFPRAIALSPNGKRLAAVEDGVLYVAEVPTGKELLAVKGAGTSIVFSPDGKTLASGAFLIDAATGKKRCQLDGPLGKILYNTFSPDGTVLATGGDEKTIQLWDPITGKERRRFAGEDEAYCHLAFSSDGKMLAAAGKEGKVYVCDLSSGKQLREFQDQKEQALYTAFLADDTSLIAGFSNGTVRVWNVATGKLLRELNFSAQHPLYVLTPDGKKLVTNGDGFVIRTWDVVTGKETTPAEDMGSNLVSVAFLPDRKSLITHHDAMLRVWEPKTGKEKHRFKVPFRQLTFSPDCKLLAYESEEVIYLLETATGEKIQCFNLGGYNMDIAISQDGKCLATDHRLEIHLWDVDTGKRVQTLDKVQRPWSHLCFLPNGKQLLSASMAIYGDIINPPEHLGLIYLWDLQTGKVVRQLGNQDDRQVGSMNVSPCGKILATSEGCDYIPYLWDLQTGEKIVPAGDFAPGWPVAFSPDSRLLANGNDKDKSIHVWEIASWREVRRFQGHLDSISNLGFSPDGKLLASGSSDNVLVWDVFDLDRARHGKLSEKELEELWNDLRGADVPAAFRAVNALVLVPQQSVPFLQ